MRGRRPQPSSWCHVGDTGETRLYVARWSAVDWSVRQDSQFDGDALWDAQPVKADERGSNMLWSSDSKGPFIATQLNSTSSWVELRRRSVYSDADATQLNSTRLTYFVLIGCTLFNWVICIADRRRQLSCVGEGVYSDATQLNSTSSWVVSL